MSNTRRHNYKATLGTDGGWYGRGYGDTPGAALDDVLAVMPEPEHARKITRAEICERQDRGETWAFPADHAIPRTDLLAVFEAHGIPASRIKI